MGHFVKLLDYSTIKINRQLISKYLLLHLLKTISVAKSVFFEVIILICMYGFGHYVYFAS